MSRRKLLERHIRKLSRVGGGKSYSVTIPLEMIKTLKWIKTQKVVFELNKKKKELKIKDWKK